MGIALILAAGLGWILLFEPKWLTNHWAHWIGLRDD